MDGTSILFKLYEINSKGIELNALEISNYIIFYYLSIKFYVFATILCKPYFLSAY